MICGDVDKPTAHWSRLLLHKDAWRPTRIPAKTKFSERTPARPRITLDSTEILCQVPQYLLETVPSDFLETWQKYLSVVNVKSFGGTGVGFEVVCDASAGNIEYTGPKKKKKPMSLKNEKEWASDSHCLKDFLLH